MPQRIKAIEYIRGLAMLGVIGIHTGAWSLSNPDANIHLFAMLEIASRFSVPIFFFISAFGIFYHENSGGGKASGIPFGRFRSIFIPYLCWSLLYMLNYSRLYGDTTIWQLPKLAEYLLFGLASYQLYFLVILLAFLLCLPVLRPLAAWLAQKPLPRLGGLLLLQILFNTYSSYWLKPATEIYWLRLLLDYRLNYLPLHYLWIFMLGAVLALRYPQWQSVCQRLRRPLAAGFWGSLLLMLGSYYYVVLNQGFSLAQAAFTIHQLSPAGVIYTGAAAFYFSYRLALPQAPIRERLLSSLARHSFFIYLIHPWVMSLLGDLLTSRQWLMTPWVTLLFFIATTFFSLLLAYAAQGLSRVLPVSSLLLTGKMLSRKKLSASSARSL
ncbi:MAG: acyltransferase [Sporomusaceae bacterium]|nr:acyltransferase [Sporomusaceae bacterium]